MPTNHAAPATLAQIAQRESDLWATPTTHRRCAGGPNCQRADTHGLPRAPRLAEQAAAIDAGTLPAPRGYSPPGHTPMHTPAPTARRATLLASLRTLTRKAPR